ncbi:hypothetical protein B484DRAFT_67179 [Ochromonadaceae sp. CCMP2298]|nr:hypothetical protein B484DRAFT_67179 [Ochromonadaceae sp. CCMP2298]
MVALIDDHNLKTQMTQNKHTPKNQQITTENPIKTHINTRHPIKTHLAIMAACDQLSRERKKGVFEGFSEGPLNFPPTYKFIPGTEEYDQRAEKKMRVPAWCDRVLWRSHRNTDVSQLLYCSHPLRLSDHKVNSRGNTPRGDFEQRGRLRSSGAGFRVPEGDKRHQH